MKLQTELQQFVNTERQKLEKKEAAVYLALFRQLDDEISKYAKAHGSSWSSGNTRPRSTRTSRCLTILKALNRTILYEEGLDITDEILKALAASHGGAAKSTMGCANYECQTNILRSDLS